MRRNQLSPRVRPLVTATTPPGTNQQEFLRAENLTPQGLRYASDPDRRGTVPAFHVAGPELSDAVVAPAVDFAFGGAAAGESSAGAKLNERQISYDGYRHVTGPSSAVAQLALHLRGVVLAPAPRTARSR